MRQKINLKKLRLFRFKFHWHFFPRVNKKAESTDGILWKQATVKSLI